MDDKQLDQNNCEDTHEIKAFVAIKHKIRQN
jgi:hypothetical protein